MPNVMLTKMDRDDQLDKMIAYLKDTTGEVQLSAKQEEQMKRYRTTYDLLYQHGSRATVAKILSKVFDYGLRTAYMDIQNTEILFGTANKAEKDFVKNWASDNLRKCIIAAITEKRYREVAALMKELRETIGYGNTENELPDFSKFFPPRVVIGFYPELMNVELPQDIDYQLEQLKKTKLKKNIFVEDIDFTELKNGEKSSS